MLFFVYFLPCWVHIQYSQGLSLPNIHLSQEGLLLFAWSFHVFLFFFFSKGQGWLLGSSFAQRPGPEAFSASRGQQQCLWGSSLNGGKFTTMCGSLLQFLFHEIIFCSVGYVICLLKRLVWNNALDIPNKHQIISASRRLRRFCMSVYLTNPFSCFLCWRGAFSVSRAY